MTIKFKYEIEINKSLDQVIRLFRDRNLLSKWQHGLLNSERLPGGDGPSKFKLTFDLGRRKMIMTETIVRDELPELYEQCYEMKGVQHTVLNSFYAISNNTTKWNSEVAFRFSGLKKFIAGLMKSRFEQQSLMLMRSFKEFAERR